MLEDPLVWITFHLVEPAAKEKEDNVFFPQDRRLKKRTLSWRRRTCLVLTLGGPAGCRESSGNQGRGLGLWLGGCCCCAGL